MLLPTGEQLSLILRKKQMLQSWYQITSENTFPLTASCSAVLGLTPGLSAPQSCTQP